MGITFAGSELPRRGDVLCYPNEPANVASSFHACLFRVCPSDEPLGGDLCLRLATQNETCRVLDPKTCFILPAIEQAGSTEGENKDYRVIEEVLIETSNTMVVEEFRRVPSLGRFVLERNGQVCAGGVVTSLDLS